MAVTAAGPVPHVVSDADVAYRKIFLRILPFLMFCYLLAFVDRSNIGFAKLHFMRDLGFSEAVYGFAAGVFYLGYILCEVPSNLILERIGVRKTLMRIMVVWGLCAAATAAITADWHLYVLRFLLGAGEAGFFPGMLFYLTLWTPAKRRARLTAVFMASIGVSGIIGGPLSGWIMTSMAGVHGLAGWQWLFIVEGLPTVACGIVAFFYLQDSPRDATWLTDREKALVLADLEAESAAQKERSHHSFGAALRAPKFYVLVGLALGLLAGTGGIFFWLPTIIRNAGVKDVLTVGLLSAIPFIVGVAVQQIVAWHSDKTLERRWHAAGPALIAGLGWVVLPAVSSSPALSLAALTLTTAGTLGAMGPFWTLPASFLTGPARAGGIALITTLGGVGSFFSPWLVGWITSHTGTLTAGQYYYGALMVVGAVVLLLGIEDTRQPAGIGRGIGTSRP
ncbi:MFS transporter [Rhodoplanes sp. TEM]|uniref:MFS transporter n=1 Tax=Rhodoplanes tepidamans TaxID=200616 RepID=A0ABT5JJ81_RHOTP|nr:MULTISPECIES: MFS transporter [Rhodoplanes]MDC7789647.1 MFS transporter [Rhodoplanes tepidamans]MDC7985256.1 MFS transporter [Rhodoplanes sp. TEM]MDQ0353583.1 MFS family permease [Rhodoplanes tepidamans]